LRARLAAASNKAEKDKIVTKMHKISLYAPVEGK